MKLKLIILLMWICSITISYCQSNTEEEEEVRKVIMEYFESTRKGEPDRLRKAFHPNLNLYAVDTEGSLKVTKGEAYIKNIKSGVQSNRIGKILLVDIDQNVAIAKAEVRIPGWRIFTDYLLLAKEQGSWKILHKSYTWKPLQ